MTTDNNIIDRLLMYLYRRGTWKSTSRCMTKTVYDFGSALQKPLVYGILFSEFTLYTNRYSHTGTSYYTNLRQLIVFLIVFFFLNVRTETSGNYKFNLTPQCTVRLRVHINSQVDIAVEIGVKVKIEIVYIYTYGLVIT